MNKIILCGRLTADIEMRYTNDGKAVASFNFAVNRRFKRDGDTSADFFSVRSIRKDCGNIRKVQCWKGNETLN